MAIAGVQRGHAVIAEAKRDDWLECPTPAKDLPPKDDAEPFDSEEGELAWERRSAHVIDSQISSLELVARAAWERVVAGSTRAG